MVYPVNTDNRIAQLQEELDRELAGGVASNVLPVLTALKNVRQSAAAGGPGGTSAVGTAVIYDIVGGTTGLFGIWDGSGGKVYPASGGAAIAVGTAGGNATNLRIPGSSSTASGGGVAVIYDVVGGATGLEGAWDVANKTVWPKDGSAAIAIGTATGNATNLDVPASSTPAVTSQTTQYTAIRNNAAAGIVNTQRYDRYRLVSSINGAVLSTSWIDRTGGTALTPTQVAAIVIGSDFAASPPTVTNPASLQSQDWIVVPNAGDTASGLARRAIAREYVVQNEAGTVTPFWTNANNAAITAPARTNLVRAEIGYPEALSVEYALNSAPTAFLNGFAIRLPGGGFDLYSDYLTATLIPQGAAAAEAIATSIRPRTVSSASSIVPLTAIANSTKIIEVPEPGDPAVAGSASVPFRPAPGALALSATPTDRNGIPTTATAIAFTVWPSTTTRGNLTNTNQAYLASLCLIYTLDGSTPTWGTSALAPNGTALKYGDRLILSRTDALNLRILSNSDTNTTTPTSPGRPQLTFYGLIGDTPQAPIYSAYDWSLLGSGTQASTPTSNTATYTVTVVTLPANTSTQLLAANANRRYLRWMNIGLNPMTVSPGSGAAVVGQGFTYSGASAAGEQGGSDTFDGAACPAGQLNAISTLGTTVVVWEGV